MRAPPRHRRRWIIAAAAMIALVFGLRLWLSWVGPLPGDRAALLRAIDYHRPGAILGQIENLWASIGTALGAALTLAIAGATLWRTEGPRGGLGLALAAVVVIVNAIFKTVLSPTPLWAEHSYLMGGNYPSGHVAYASAVFGYLGVIGYRRRRPEVWATCAVLIVGMGPARVLDGSHLISDAIAGYLLGFGWLMLVLALPDYASSSSASSGSPSTAARASSV